MDRESKERLRRLAKADLEKLFRQYVEAGLSPLDLSDLAFMVRVEQFGTQTAILARERAQDELDSRAS